MRAIGDVNNYLRTLDVSKTNQISGMLKHISSMTLLHPVQRGQNDRYQNLIGPDVFLEAMKDGP